MSSGECDRLLSEVGWGVLAVVETGLGDARPIGVPVSYALSDGQLFLTMSAGRKLSALKRNPTLSLTVTDVHAFNSWRSLLVLGRARWLTTSLERAEATRAFGEASRRSSGDVTPNDEQRLTEAHLLAITVDEVHGYASAGVRSVERRSVGAMDAMDALRRVVRRTLQAEAETEQALGVTAAQLFVMREVAKVQPLTISALARATATSQSSVSEVVNRLVARELLTRERSHADRRRAEIRLSFSGRELLSRASETVQEQLIAGFQRLPGATQRALSESLSSWLVEAGLSDIGPSMFFESPASGKR